MMEERRTKKATKNSQLHTDYKTLQMEKHRNEKLQLELTREREQRIVKDMRRSKDEEKERWDAWKKEEEERRRWEDEERRQKVQEEREERQQRMEREKEESKIRMEMLMTMLNMIKKR